MAHPKKKTTKSKRNMRRSHHAVKPDQKQNCSKCGSTILPHHACANCGTYKGRKVEAIKLS